MANEIKELIDKIVKSDIKLSELLRHAMLIAKKHNNQDFLSWIELEMNGYDNSESRPEYRFIRGIPKMHSTTGQWLNLIVPHSEMQKDMSKMFMSTPIAELESLIEKSKGEVLVTPYPEDMQAKFSKITKPLADKYVLAFPTSLVTAILDMTRNNLLGQLSDLDANAENGSNEELLDNIFPPEFMSKLPTDIRQLTDDFNFNFSHNRPYACMLILRRILPLSIVRRYQRDNKENDIKKDGDFLETKTLLGKVQSLIRQRLYKDLLLCKMLLDASQHSYTFRPEINDVREAATVLRLFLDELFPENIN